MKTKAILCCGVCGKYTRFSNATATELDHTSYTCKHCNSLLMMVEAFAMTFDLIGIEYESYFQRRKESIAGVS